jgi:Flp pilus assembly pilin Flp
MFRAVRRLLASEDGPTATEYAVLLALIAVAVLGAMAMFGQHMSNLYVAVDSGVDVFTSTGG